MRGYIKNALHIFEMQAGIFSEMNLVANSITINGLPAILASRYMSFY
jgi:hypothetical protein